MKAEDRFTAGRERKNEIDCFCHGKWHHYGAAIEFVGPQIIGKGAKRLTVSMSKDEAFDLAMWLLKAVRES